MAAKPVLVLPIRNWTPSFLAAASLISTMIASTSTCSRRVSIWRMVSPSIRCTSLLAATMMAFAPSYRVTIAGPRVLIPPLDEEEADAAATGAAACEAGAPPCPPPDAGVEDVTGSLVDWPTSCCSTGSSFSASACSSQ